MLKSLGKVQELPGTVAIITWIPRGMGLETVAVNLKGFFRRSASARLEM